MRKEIKVIPLFIIAFLLSCGLKAQSLTPTVIASGGEYFSNTNGSLSWTMGEVAVDYLANSNNSLSQGFQQSYSIVSSVQQAITPAGFSFYVFPNPARDILNIRLENPSGSNYHMYLMDALGRTHREMNLSGAGMIQSELNLEGLAKGLYFLHVVSSDKELKTIKIEHF